MQLQTLLSWLPQVGVTTIPGFIHQWLAARELEKSIGFSIISPYKSWRYWVLRAFFFALPIVLFWLVVPLVFRVEPPTLQRNLKDWVLWGMAIGLGFFLPYFLKAPISILAIGSSDAGPTYKIVVDIFSKTIRAHHQRQTDDFWALVGDDLRSASDRTKQQNYRDGHAHLFDRLIIPINATNRLSTLEEAWQTELRERLEAIVPKRSSRSEPSHKTVQLLKWLTQSEKVTRRELPSILYSFGCDQCAQQYFSNVTKGSRPHS